MQKKHFAYTRFAFKSMLTGSHYQALYIY